MIQFINTAFTKSALSRFGGLLASSAILTLAAHLLHLTPDRPALLSAAAFSLMISATLFFWERRLPIALLTICALIATQSATLDQLNDHLQPGLLLFICGMMMITGALRELGLFSWIIQRVITYPRLNGPLLTTTLCFLSALLSAVTGEIAAITVMLTLVFQICDTLHLRAAPFVIITVIATNIGSAATLLGNPVSVFIAGESGLTFWDFFLHATPAVFLSLCAVTLLFLVWYRTPITEMTCAMRARQAEKRALGPLLQPPCKSGMLLLLATLLLLAFNPQIARLIGLEKPAQINALLMVTPAAIAATRMLLCSPDSRKTMLRNINGFMLFFFAALFAIAGALQINGVTDAIADAIYTRAAHSILPATVLFTSALGSAFIDNIVFVSAFSPVIQQLGQESATLAPLWKPLLFGACFGGNITAIGSTANIIAIGMLRQRTPSRLYFWEWIGIGLTATALSLIIARLFI